MTRRPGWADDDDPRTARLREIERGVESRLQEMAEAGELSGLPGEGKPLRMSDDASEDRWAAVHVMRNANVAPEWSDVRREIDAQHAALVVRARRHLAWLRSREAYVRTLPAERILEAARATREGDARGRSGIATAIAELNRLVHRYDLIVPVAALQIVPFTPDGVFAEAERPAR